MAVMEITEVAVAIKQKYPRIWPLSFPQAHYVATKEAAEQGAVVIAALTDALLALNPQVAEAV